jgi:hypothetical protein
MRKTIVHWWLSFLTGGNIMPGTGIITFGRKELVAHLAAIANRLANNEMKGGGAVQPSVYRISSYITECGKEFDLTNAEQLLFLKFIVAGKESAEELLRGE